MNKNHVTKKTHIKNLQFSSHKYLTIVNIQYQEKIISSIPAITKLLTVTNQSKDHAT